MTKKYIVKNCPACYLYGNKYGCEDNHDEQGRDTYCQNIDDCLIKQIVDKCKFRSNICKDCGSDVCFECEHLTGGILANEILQLFTIEEVE